MSVVIIYGQGWWEVFMWGNEMLLKPAPLWKHCPTRTHTVNAGQSLSNWGLWSTDPYTAQRSLRKVILSYKTLGVPCTQGWANVLKSDSTKIVDSQSKEKLCKCMMQYAEKTTSTYLYSSGMRRKAMKSWLTHYILASLSSSSEVF